MAELKPIVEAGGWVFAAFVLLLMLEGFRREWWVPGRVYRREVKRGDEAVAATRTVAQATRQAVRGGDSSRQRRRRDDDDASA